jgi:hypothetical protein
MLRVRGIYDGKQILLTEDLPVPPNTEVEVLVPSTEAEREEIVLQRLVESGVITRRRRPVPTDRDFKPISIKGEPISQTIIENRR